MIKFSNNQIDAGIANLLLSATPDAEMSFENGDDIRLITIRATPEWKAFTAAIAAIKWVDSRHSDGCQYFDLFYEEAEMQEFWNKHLENCDLLSVNFSDLKKLGDASKTHTLEGKELEEEGDYSEYAFTKALSNFVGRPYISSIELEYAIIDAAFQQMMDVFVEEGLLEVVPPKEGECEINYSFVRTAKFYETFGGSPDEP